VEVAAKDDFIKKLVADDDLIIEDALFRAIQKGQENGDINTAKDPKVIARFLCNTVAGMRVYAKFKNDRHFFDDIVEAALSVLD
jgi:TetR/AcrR family transcriptional repressor of nem operon